MTRARHLEKNTTWSEVMNRMQARDGMYVGPEVVELVAADTVWLDDDCVPAMPVLVRYTDGLVSMDILYSADYGRGWGFVSVSSAAIDSIFESHDM